MPSLEKEWSTTVRLLGYWWLADKPDSKIPGCLEIADGRIRLELIGTVENEVFGTYFGEPTIHPIIQGVAQGKVLTLVDCRTIGSEQSIGRSNSSPVSKVDVTYAVEGAHFGNREDLQFSEAIVRYHFLEDWVQDQPVEHDLAPKNDRDFTTRFVLADDRRFTCSIDSSFLTVTSEYSSAISGQDDHFTFRNTLRFGPPEKQHLQWFIDRSGSICHLLSFLMGEQTAIASFQLVPDDSLTVPNRPLTLFVRHWVFTSSRKRFHPLEMRYCYPILKDRFTKILDFWLGKSDQLETAFALVSGAQQDKDLPVRYQFLNCVHALECLDRAISNRGYMSPEDYATVRQKISKSIPTDLDSGHREAIKKKIEYGYEFSLRKRLAEMLKEMPDNLVTMICTDSKLFPNLIADTRNYFAHYTPELKEKAVLDTHRLYWFSQQLSIWCTAVLLLQMGLNAEEVELGLRRCPHLRWIVERGPRI
jgi:hypothetical protein